MLHKLCYFYFFAIIGFQELKAQENLQLNFEEFDIFFTPRKCPDTISFNLKGKYQGCMLNLYLEESQGKAYFELKKKGRLLLNGYYENGIDTLQRYRIGKFRGESNRDSVEKYSIAVVKYLYPLKTGRWTFYKEEKGKIKESKSLEYIYVRYPPR